MAKSSGLGDNFYVAGYNVSGDVNALGNISSPRGVLEDTGIDKSAMERLLGLQDGQVEFTSFFNDAAGQEHAALKTLPTADIQVMYFRGTTVGNAAAAMTAKQINYDGTRAADGGFTFQCQAQANGYGLEWGQMLTPGVKTDTGALNGASIDTGASLSFGGQAYLQVFSFSGTDATVKIQDSADDSSFTTVAGFTFTQTTAAPTFERLAISNTSTIRRYVRAQSITTGGFTSLSFAVMVVKNPIAGRVF